jgi:copper chaperone CopZ
MKTAIFIFGLVGLLLISGCVSNTGQAATNTSNKTGYGDQSQGLRKVELSIEGLWCESCVYGIKSLMQKAPGIESVEIQITDLIAQTGKGEITYNPTQITKEEIAKLTEPYPSRIVKDFPVN